MNSKEIEKIWTNYITSDEYQEVGFSNRALALVDDKIMHQLDEMRPADVEVAAMDIIVDAEEAGFIQGFQMATRLMCECFVKGDK